MKTPKTFREVMVDVEMLLGAVKDNADKLANAEALRSQLEQTLAELKDVAIRREALQAAKQVLSQDLKERVAKARDLSVDLRAVIKGTIGARSEQLRQFSVSPRRAGVRRSRGTTPEPAKPAPALPATTPAPTPAGPVTNG